MPKEQRFRVTEAELVKLIHMAADNGMTVSMAFGPGWSDLTWTDGEPMPKAVKCLLMMRGVLNENTDGAGI